MGNLTKKIVYVNFCSHCNHEVRNWKRNCSDREKWRGKLSKDGLSLRLTVPNTIISLLYSMSFARRWRPYNKLQSLIFYVIWYLLRRYLICNLTTSSWFHDKRWCRRRHIVNDRHFWRRMSIFFESSWTIKHFIG